MTPDDPSGTPKSAFERAAEGEERPFVAELVAFLRENKRWWLVPILATLGLLAGFLFAGTGPLAPFIYTLF